MARRVGSQRAIEAAEKQRRALEARARGLSWDEVAAEAGFTNRGSAWRSVRAALVDIPREAADQLRQLELERLDEMYLVLRRRLDVRPSAILVDAMLKIHERRARMLGLDAPITRRIDVVTTDAVEAEIARLEGLLERGDEGDPVL